MRRARARAQRPRARRAQAARAARAQARRAPAREPRRPASCARGRVRSRLRLAQWMWAFVSYVFPFLFRAALPGHNPRRERDPQWVTDWLGGYARAEPGVVPLVDTLHPEMPVPFPVRS